MWFALFLFITAFAASFVQATAGFAFTIIIMALWPLFLPVPEASQLLMFGSLIPIACITFRYRRHINFRITAIPMILGLLGTYIGVNALLTIDNAIIIKVLGGFLIVLALYFFAFSSRICIAQNPLTASVTGFLSGLMGGVFNMPGPPMVLYCTVTSQSKEEYLATTQFYFLVLLLFRIVYMWMRRGLSDLVISHTPVVVVGSLGGMFLGLWLFKKLSSKTIKKIVYVLMILSGLWYIIQ